jgi:hypothetical protein
MVFMVVGSDIGRGDGRRVFCSSWWVLANQVSGELVRRTTAWFSMKWAVPIPGGGMVLSDNSIYWWISPDSKD